MDFFLYFLLGILCMCSGLVAIPLLDSPCGDWIPYKDEECIKLITRSGAQSKENADDICQTFAEGGDAQHVPKLVKIKTKEKQEFLEEILFKTHSTFDNVWLGLEMGNDSVFRWNDGTDLFFSNWAENTEADHDHRCVQMESGESVHKTGLWVKTNCKKSNAVVCERTQTWSLTRLQNIVLSLKLEVERNKKEAEADIMATNKEANEKVSKVKQETESKITEAERKITVLKQDADKRLKEADGKINAVKQESEAKISEVKKQAEGAINTAKKDADKKIDNLVKNPVPVGFIYVQLPGQDPPAKIWPVTKWSDVSSSYAGLFFRVSGGNSAPIGQIQEGSSPRLANVEMREIGNGGGPSKVFAIPANGGWSDFVFTGDPDGDNDLFLRFQLSPGEVRPRNKAVLIWKRTA